MARLEPEALDALMAGKLGTLFAAGEDLIVEGSRVTDVFMLISAQVRVTAKLDKGTALLAVRVGGDLVGEIAAADGGIRSATVTATHDDSIAVMIPGSEFIAVIDRYPAASHLYMAELTRKLRAATRRRVDFTAYKVSTRIARVLAEMAGEYGQPVERKPEARTLRVGLSQAGLATLVGAKEASTVQALKDLHARGILEWGYRTVTIPDISALRIAGRLEPDVGAHDDQSGI
jgi:CRP-like cAMP-binding protein